MAGGYSWTWSGTPGFKSPYVGVASLSVLKQGAHMMSLIVDDNGSHQCFPPAGGLTGGIVRLHHCVSDTLGRDDRVGVHDPVRILLPVSWSDEEVPIPDPVPPPRVGLLESLETITSLSLLYGATSRTESTSSAP